jgi:hypothetical protein
MNQINQTSSYIPSSQSQNTSTSHPFVPTYNQQQPPTSAAPTQSVISGAQRMAQTTIKNHFPDFERGKRLNMLEYVYAKPLVMKGGRKRKALGVDGEFSLL